MKHILYGGWVYGAKLDYTLYKSDSSTDLDKDPLPDDGGDDNQGGSGSGEAPDPAA